MQTIIENQKAVADKVLDKLELLDPACIVAGGAPRDWYLGNPSRDIDIFLYAPQLVSSSIKADTLRKLGFHIINEYGDWNKNEMYQHNQYVQCLYNIVLDKEHIQIIFMNKSTYKSVVDQFPISISKVWYKNKIITLSSDAKNSIKHKIIWRTSDIYSDDNKYIIKIKNKFSNYIYVTLSEAKQIITEGNTNELIKNLKIQLSHFKNENNLLKSDLKLLTLKYNELLKELKNRLDDIKIRIDIE